MPAKKAAKKAAKEAPAKKAPAKKAVAKNAVEKAPAAAMKKATPAAKKASAAPASVKSPSLGDIAHAAYLNYRSRVEKGAPGDMLGDWLAAEKKLRD